MGLPEDLLDQARELMEFDPRRPKQASLRRAVSTAYYALFHLLIREASQLLAPASPPELRLLVARSFDHWPMKKQAAEFAKKTMPYGLSHVAPNQDVVYVAETFVALQDARHKADYDLIASFTKTQVRIFVTRTGTAFSHWQRAKNTDAGNLFLAALLAANGRWKT